MTPTFTQTVALSTVGTGVVAFLIGFFIRPVLARWQIRQFRLAMRSTPGARHFWLDSKASSCVPQWEAEFNVKET